MRLVAGALLCTLAVAGHARAGDLTCEEALRRVDTFGEMRWFDPAPALVGSKVDFDCMSDCSFTDLQGVEYEYLNNLLTDKQLRAGTGTPWPWGLDASDGPAEVRAKLAKLLPKEGSMSVREGGPTYNLDIPGCGAWIEVTFGAEGRGIKAVSLNAQP